MSDKISNEEVTLESLQEKLESSSRINAELIEREKKALDSATQLKAELEVFKKAEEEAKAAAEKAETAAKLEAEIERRVQEILKAENSLEVIDYEPEPNTEPKPIQKSQEQLEKEAAIKEAAERIK